MHRLTSTSSSSFSGSSCWWCRRRVLVSSLIVGQCLVVLLLLLSLPHQGVSAETAATAVTVASASRRGSVDTGGRMIVIQRLWFKGTQWLRRRNHNQESAMTRQRQQAQLHQQHHQQQQTQRQQSQLQQRPNYIRHIRQWLEKLRGGGGGGGGGRGGKSSQSKVESSVASNSSSPSGSSVSESTSTAAAAITTLEQSDRTPPSPADTVALTCASTLESLDPTVDSSPVSGHNNGYDIDDSDEVSSWFYEEDPVTAALLQVLQDDFEQHNRNRFMLQPRPLDVAWWEHHHHQDIIWNCSTSDMTNNISSLAVSNGFMFQKTTATTNTTTNAQLTQRRQEETAELQDSEPSHQVQPSENDANKETESPLGSSGTAKPVTVLTINANDELAKFDEYQDDNIATISSQQQQQQQLQEQQRNRWHLPPKKLQFLDKIAWITTYLLRREGWGSISNNNAVTADSLWSSNAVVIDDYPDLVRHHHNDDVALGFIDPSAPTPQSDLSRPGRYFHIVTTAALPWFTGTAVNPLLRAAHLHRRTQQQATAATGNDDMAQPARQQQHQRFVTLVIPWLELPQDQRALYDGRVFASPQEQEDYIRDWLRNDAGMPDVACHQTGLLIVFYPARYHSGLRSIFAMGDIIVNAIQAASGATITTTSDPPLLDVCILEEPEHCNWFRAPGDGWTKRFQYVVGVVHTNYKEYASSHYSGLWTAPAIQLVSAALVRAYCHKVIKLSDSLHSYAPEKEVTANVHGVRADFLSDTFSPQHIDAARESSIYFIGKILWAKGFDLLLELEDYYKRVTGSYFPIDIYGSGPDEQEIMRAFHGRQKALQGGTDPKPGKGVLAHSTIGTMQDEHDYGDRQIRILGSTVVLANGRFPLPNLRRRHIDVISNNNINNNNSTTPAVSSNRDDFATVLESLQLKAKQQFSKWKQTISLNDNQSLEDFLPSLESIQAKAKEQFLKIIETINAVDLPKTFSEFRREPIPAKFHGRVDHASLRRYKVFVNPSISEVLCTTTAEALAMGKFAIIPVHPSNTFFLQFPNCLAYRNKFEFVASLRWALTHDPEPLTADQRRAFSWEAATDRLIEASVITYQDAFDRERLGLSKLDERIAWFHNELGKGATGDLLRKLFGAGPVSDQVKYQMLQQQQQQGDGADPTDGAVAPSRRRNTTHRYQNNDDDDDDLSSLIVVSSEQGNDDDGDDENDADEVGDQDDGLGFKFRHSALAEAIRSTVTDLKAFIQ